MAPLDVAVTAWNAPKRGQTTFTLLQVPAEPVCQDVFGPTVPGNQQDLRPAGRGPDPAVHVRRRPTLRPAGLLLPDDAAHARGPRSAGAGHARQIRSALVRDSLWDCHWWVSFPGASSSSLLKVQCVKFMIVILVRSQCTACKYSNSWYTHSAVKVILMYIYIYICI